MDQILPPAFLTLEGPVDDGDGGIRDVPKSDIDKITHLNVMREFSFDPFKTTKREDATVGALRARAKHVKTEPEPSMGGLKSPYDPDRPVTSADVKRVLNVV